MKLLISIGALLQLCSYAIAQRVAPGVPPQHYQAPQYQGQGQGNPQYQQQQYQQQQPHAQQQYQQPPQQQAQYQQQPVQNQQAGHHQQPPHQQPPHQQPPQHQQQIHAQHGPPQQVLSGNMQHEKQHIAEHMDVPIDTSKMTEQELQFHYFKMHDSDNNNKLDGCELIKSLIHWHEQGKHQEGHHEEHTQPPHEDKIFSNDELSALIDPILNADDHNKDGYIDYPEFVRAQHKASTQDANKQQQQPQANRV